MRHIALIALILFGAAGSAKAELNANYRGVDRMTGDEVPATAQFSIEPGRVAVILKGSHDCRMLFLEGEGVLRFVDDVGKTYFDMEKSWIGSSADDQAAVTAGFEQELAQLPPDQQDAARELLRQALESEKAPAAPEYVRTKEKTKVLGYDCTKVEIMRDGDKRGEYWGTPSKDLQMSDAERKTMQSMGEYLRRLTQMAPAGAGDAATGAFEWDLSSDGFPLITRCFEKGKMELDLKAESFDRKALSKELFEIPSDYKELSIPVPEK